MKAIKITILLEQPMNPHAEEILKNVMHDALCRYTVYDPANVTVEEADVVKMNGRLQESEKLIS